MELNREKCHNFDMAEKLGRCPCVSVCTDDCVYVWKYCYDHMDEFEQKEIEIEELENRVNDLENEKNSLEEEKDDAESRASDWEEKYHNVINDLARVTNEESIDKLNEKVHEGIIDYDWVEDLSTEWGIRHVSRT